MSKHLLCYKLQYLEVPGIRAKVVGKLEKGYAWKSVIHACTPRTHKAEP